MLQAIQRDYKLSSYSLNSVSSHFLGLQKEERASLGDFRVTSRNRRNEKTFSGVLFEGCVFAATFVG